MKRASYRWEDFWDMAHRIAYGRFGRLMKAWHEVTESRHLPRNLLQIAAKSFEGAYKNMFDEAFRARLDARVLRFKLHHVILWSMDRIVR